MISNTKDSLTVQYDESKGKLKEFSGKIAQAAIWGKISDKVKDIKDKINGLEKQ